MSEFDVAWQAWRDAREQRLRDPHGWLAVTSLQWLTPAAERFDGVPGTWSYGERGAVVVLGARERLALGDRPLGEGTHELGPVDPEGLRLSCGGAVVEVAQRDGGVLLRPRRPDSPRLLDYRGTPTYAPDPTWVIKGHFAPYSAAGEPSDEGIAVGEVVFEYDGAEHRLVAWGEDDGSLWVLFRDATSGVTTYAASRQLLLPPPSSDGTVEIDFNRATNLPCAYTEFATCPVPPAANVLGFEVVAGEQVPLLGPGSDA